MKKIILFTVLLMFLPIVFSDFNYTEVGTPNQDFRTGSGFFNAQSTNITTSSRALSDPHMIPLVGDLDGDGVNEIVVADGSSFRLYATQDLDIVDTFTSVNITGTPYFILFDIDDDNKTEIISIDDELSVVQIIEYNGTSMFVQANYNITSHTDGEVMVQCKGVEDCLAVTIDFDECSGGGCGTSIRGTHFNSTSASSTVTIEGTNNRGATKNFRCLPKIKAISVEDYDNDGKKEYIFSHLDVAVESPEVDEDVILYYIDVNNTGALVAELIVTVTDPGDLSNLLFIGGCSGLNYGKHLTNTLVGDFDLSPSNGLETVIGYMINDDEFNMEIFDSTGSSLDEYPALADADGQIVSNVIRMNAFDDASNSDFCVMGYNETGGFVDLLCASEINNVGLFDNVQYKFDVSQLFNITTTFDSWNAIIHQGKHISSDSPNTDEVITSYGVFNLDFDSCSIITGNCDMTLDWETVVDDTALIPVDVEKVGRNDMLALSSTNIWYIDDGFTNSPGQITEYTINPCLDSTWKENTTVNVQVEVTDVDGDQVQANSILYLNDANEQDAGNSTFSASGTTFSFSFVANKTIGTSTLRLIGRDAENPTVDDEIDLSFSVATNGVEFGDCTTNVEIGIVAEPTTLAETFGVNTTDNALLNGVSTFDDITGLGSTVIWLIFMIGFAVAILLMQGISDMNAKIGVIAIGEFLMVVIGTILGFLSVGITVVISIVFIVIIAMWFRRFILGS